MSNERNMDSIFCAAIGIASGQERTSFLEDVCGDDTELRDRVEELLAAARKHEIPVICMHLGGESRRGQLSDDFISSFLPHAKVAIVVKSGNKDGFFSTLCEQSKISLIEVERAADALQPLTEFFSPEK